MAKCKTTDKGCSLAELARKTGTPPRTIRFYIARELLAGPSKAGRGASYGNEHIARIAQIRQLQSSGLTLAEVALRLGGEPAPPALESPTPWWNYRLDEDVVVQVRGDAGPWRLRQIQRALADTARVLQQTKSEEKSK